MDITIYEFHKIVNQAIEAVKRVPHGYRAITFKVLLEVMLVNARMPDKEAKAK